MAQARERYVVDEKGRRRSVVLPLREYQQLLQDLQDLATIAERKEEPREPFETVRARLETKWLRTNSK
ncbi:MAG: hypothetical protein HW397_380 [Dehalococcoidia bacterium]|nr:hypothetical protein [Dehalococcoidia bacterium]